jgi:hypothetical protein
MAMILAGFLKSDIADEIVRQQVRRRLALMGGTDNNQREVLFVDVNNAPSLSDFTSDNDASLPTTSHRHPPARQTPSRKESRSGRLHLLSNNGALITLLQRSTSLTRIRRPSAYLMPRRRSQMACPLGRFTMSSHRTMKPAPVLRPSAATLPMGL